MGHDLVSIILPAYNVGPTLARSIQSVLDQSYQDFELIIIDDGSIDNTQEVIKSFSDARIIHLTNEKNMGLVATLNRGVDHSKGELIARIDGDDRWIDQDKLAKQVRYMESMPECQVVGTQAQFTNGTRTSYPLSDVDIRSKILSKNVFIHSSVMFRKRSAGLSPYDQQDYLLEDYVLWLKLGLKGTLANLSDYAVEYHINPIGETQRQNLLQTQNSLRMIERFKDVYPNYTVGKMKWQVKLIVRTIRNLIHL